MSTRLVASATSVSPQALKNSFPPPNVAVPRLKAETFKSEPPTNRYSTSFLSTNRKRYSRRRSHIPPPPRDGSDQSSEQRARDLESLVTRVVAAQGPARASIPV